MLKISTKDLLHCGQNGSPDIVCDGTTSYGFHSIGAERLGVLKGPCSVKRGIEIEVSKKVKVKWTTIQGELVNFCQRGRQTGHHQDK